MNLYIHIPFCRSKCAYCAFLSHCDISKENEYVKAVCREILDSELQVQESISTIYFGGGTPSLLAPENITKIITTIKKTAPLTADCEVTLECNPENIEEKKLTAWKAAGVNRISIGVQTLNDVARKLIGRSLTAAEVLARFEIAQKYFDNVGIDLICGLPNDDIITTLQAMGSKLLTLDHISLYDLETDNDSQIARDSAKFPLADENTRAEMLLSAWKKLVELGFEQYEISNFARKAKYCRHNLDFWKGHDYLGFGLGATSKIGSQIITNVTNFESYLSGTGAPATETLSKTELVNLRLITAIRLDRPFDEAMREASILSLPPVLFEHCLVSDYQLTSRGKLLYNQVVKEILEYEQTPE